MMVAADHVPHAMFGLLLAGFMAAFMSTVATHFNWGGSYLVADFYRRFVRRDETEAHYVRVSRLVTVLLLVATAFVSWRLVTITSGWKLVLEVGAGTGGVYLLRWYWWRVNAWSEISAMLAALATTLLLHAEMVWQALLDRSQPFSGSEPVVFAKTTLTTTAVTTLVWVVVTLLTGPEPDAVLVAFYRKVRPQVSGWRRVAALAPDVRPTRDLGRNLLLWLLGCTMVYAALFGIGQLCFGRLATGGALLGLCAVSAALMNALLRRATPAD
jgi:Na+/proline symporter